MANDDNHNDAQAHLRPPEPSPDLKKLGILVGTWEVSGGAQGRVAYEWMEGGGYEATSTRLE